MTNYRDGEFIDLLPQFFKDNEDVQAISYAFRMAISKMLSYSDMTTLYADIDSQPEAILDLMALELKAPYYSEDLSISRKRYLVKNAMLWRMKAGTKAAVKALVNTIFGESDVTEWFEFTDGEGIPGQFDIEVVADITMTPEMYEEFKKVIQEVKAATSHLRNIIVTRPIMVPRYVGAECIHSMRSVIVTRATL